MNGSMLSPFAGTVTFFPSRSKTMTSSKKVSLLTINFPLKNSF